MQIEEGKCYKTRDGLKVGPMEETMWDESLVAQINGHNKLFFRANGKHEYDNRAWDLIEEWAE